MVDTAWPVQQKLDLTRSPEEAKRLVNLFFLGQFVLMSLMAPSFAAGTITGEKERKTYEMLLASPMRPMAIVLGKLLASLSHLAVLVFCSLPIVMLCLPLGGRSLYEVLARRGDGRGHGHLRHGEHGSQQLLRPDDVRGSRLVPSHPPAGPFRGALLPVVRGHVLVPAGGARLRLSRRLRGVSRC